MTQTKKQQKRQQNHKTRAAEGSRSRRGAYMLATIDSESRETLFTGGNLRPGKEEKLFRFPPVNQYKGYIITNFKVLQEQYDYLRSLLTGFNEHTFGFVAHVTASTLLKTSKEPEERFSPIYCNLIRDEFGKVPFEELEAGGIIEVNHHYSKAKKETKKYKLSDKHIDALLEIAATYYSFEELRTAEKVNLMTGNLTRAKYKSRYYDRNRNEESKTYVRSIKLVCRNGSIFNRPDVEAAINALRSEMERLKAVWEATQDERSEEDYQKAKRQWQNDYYCYYAVLCQNPEQITETLWRYKPAYRPAKTGRAQEVGGGFQSASWNVKCAARKGVEDCYNYDLEASQPNALRLWFRLACRDTSWLDAYIQTENRKAIYAARAGLSEETWKRCFIALLMGATLPRKARAPKMRERNSIIKALWKDSNGDITVMRKLHSGFTELVRPLHNELKQWHEWLDTDFITRTVKYSRGRRAYIPNDVDKRLYLDELPSHEGLRWKRRAEIAAFVLQGTESSYIHRLTTLGPRYKFKVIANEHDGVISIGEIPAEAMEEAAKLSGFLDAVLSIKELMPKNAA
jgi:hypothetical protein